MANLLDKLGRKTLGIDLFDNPIMAIEQNRGRYLQATFNEIFSQLPEKLQTGETRDKLLSGEYVGDVDLLVPLIKLAYKPLGMLLIKPSMVLPVPKDICSSELGALWKRMIQDAAIQAGASEVFTLENYICAALGTGVPLRQHDGYGTYEKCIFIYSSARATFVGLLFAGLEVDCEIIPGRPASITKEQVEGALSIVLSRLPTQLPPGYSEGKSPTMGEMAYIQQSWIRPLPRKAYAAVPGHLKSKLGFSIGNFQLYYAEDYENVIVLGLREAMKVLKRPGLVEVFRARK